MIEVVVEQIRALAGLPKVVKYDGGGGPMSAGNIPSEWLSERTWQDYSEDERGTTMYRWDMTRTGEYVLGAWEGGRAIERAAAADAIEHEVERYKARVYRSEETALVVAEIEQRLTTLAEELRHGR